MSSGRLVASRFRSVYLGLTALWTAALVASHLFAQNIVAPSLLSKTVSEIESLVRSHDPNIKYNNTRALRDELVARKLIPDDFAFAVLKPSRGEDAAALTAVLNTCISRRDHICVGKDAVAILNPEATMSLLDTISYAVVLETQLVPPNLWLAEGGVALALSGVFMLIGAGIRRQETFLLKKVSLLGKSLEAVDGLFCESGVTQSSDQDEITFASETIAQLAHELSSRTELIRGYKERFERTTRLEQLGLTVGQVSHDLKAPLNEAEQFHQLLPDLMTSMSTHQILEISESLRARIAHGKRALDAALRNTAASSVSGESADVSALLRAVRARFSAHGPTGFSIILRLPNEPVRVMGDLELLQRAFFNLAQNAFEAKQDATLTLSVDADSLGGEVRFDIQDDGPGIPNDRLDRVFDPLVTYKPGGTGFGLSSCRDIVTKCGGSIRALPCANGAHFQIVLRRSDRPLTTGVAANV